MLKLADIWDHRRTCQLYQQVLEQPDLATQVAIVEQFLCERMLSGQWKENTSIAEAIRLINQSKGNITVLDLANSLGISTRGLEKKILQTVGISPKAYCNVIRFNHAFRQLALCKKHVLDVVLDAGYYDQSHFYNT